MKKGNYGNLIRELSLTDFKLKYQGSVLGYLWSLAKPLMMFSVLYVVFTQFLRIGSSIEKYTLYLLLGIVMWMFFVEITASSLDAIVGKRDLIRKIYFPRIILVISRALTALITFCLNLIVVFVFLFINGVKPNSNFLLFPVIIIEFFILTVGISLILSALYVKFRDLSHIWEVALMALFYGTPILYPLSLVPIRYAKVLMLNPVAQIIQDARYILITKQAGTSWKLLPPSVVWIPYTLPIITFIFGYWLFNKYAAKFAEEI